MLSLIHDLENNEAILLMYLADELPAQDRAEVDQMLATDASMRTELEKLKGLLGDFEGDLGRLDLVESISSKRSAAVRRVGKAVAQWHADLLARRPKPEPPKVIGYPWWVYNVSAAAVVLVGLLAWWGFTGEPGPSIQPAGVVASRMPDGRGEPFAGDFAPWYGDGTLTASRWMMGVRPARFNDAGSDEALDQVERELVALSDEPSGGINLFGAPHIITEAVGPHE